MENPTFRCPFEIKGERDGKIIHVHLSDNYAGWNLINEAFKRLHSDRSIVSIKFHLPDSLLKRCSSLEDLRIFIVPFQAEILAAELDYRLYPFLPYQRKMFEDKEELRSIFEKEQYKFGGAHFLTKAVESCSMQVESVYDLKEWIITLTTYQLLRGVYNPSIHIDDGSGNVYLSINLGSVTFHPEDFESIVGEGNDCRNCFGIVTSPFYPKPFGRYSEDVTVVMSRMKDFTALSSEDRRKVRYKSNSVYANHGVKIDDLYEDKQPDGLWIPEYATQHSE